MSATACCCCCCCWWWWWWWWCTAAATEASKQPSVLGKASLDELWFKVLLFCFQPMRKSAVICQTQVNMLKCGPVVSIGFNASASNPVFAGFCWFLLIFTPKTVPHSQSQGYFLHNSNIFQGFGMFRVPDN